jgi:hypothetical protein
MGFNLASRNVPLFLKTGTENGDGNSFLDTKAILTEREAVFPVDTTKPFKLNGGSVGCCKCLVDILNRHITWPHISYISQTQTACFTHPKD